MPPDAAGGVFGDGVVGNLPTIHLPSGLKVDPMAMEAILREQDAAQQMVSAAATFAEGHSPITLMQNFVEVMHIYGHLPWWYAFFE